MEQRFALALRRLQKLLHDASATLNIPVRFALIGGLAVSAWGAVRATQDIDLLADSSPTPLKNPTLQAGLQRFLEERGCAVDWRVGEADDPIPLLLRLELPRPVLDLRADILWAHKRWLREALARRVEIRVSHLKVFVLHPEDLILMKLEAGGPQDLQDVEAILSNRPAELDLRRLKQRADQLHMGAKLRRCLR